MESKVKVKLNEHWILGDKKYFKGEVIEISEARYNQSILDGIKIEKVEEPKKKETKDIKE